MHALPHHYRINALANGNENLALTAEGLPALAAAAPAEFDGPGDQWSPETLFLASISSCFILSFRAIATFSKFEWSQLECDVEGVLDKQERKMRFTGVTINAKLSVADGVDKEKAKSLLEKAEQNCLVSNSLACPVHLNISI
ncbi:OsmC family protein [Spongiibacter sp. KMU-158]|uniref:OsmC family protein n=1 Tax=Spongiibacter pelagi TaxID=2760804 RepID=A0A927C0R4_9GAMM|nr:OsmC family protein [Spongiibacter pelagi]MBD2857917.1 OsmC family protein [Spongiibacter pelagi]